MTYVISDECTACGVCADACPMEAIASGAAKYEIDPAVCSDCGTCVDECPNGAIAEK